MRLGMGRLTAAVSVGLCGFGLLGASSALAEETKTFGYTGEEQAFNVPAGVTSVHVVATGAPGAAGLSTTEHESLGGLGAIVSGTLAVTPEETLYVEVGGPPAGGDCYFELRCVGGFNGGGTSFFGGGGGGASDVRTISIGAEPSPGNKASLESRLLVAAGGGGGSEPGVSLCFPEPFGGNGGNAQESGGDGGVCAAGEPGRGGGAGKETAGGAGGSELGEAGSLGVGGDGGSDQGGAGGGGLYGGGGGGETNFRYEEEEEEGEGSGGAGGGGGGSNLVPAGGGSGIAKAGEEPSVTISYTPVSLPECAGNTGSITLSPGLTDTAVYQSAKVKGTLTGCTDEAFTEAKYTASLTTASKVSCSALTGSGVPMFGSVKYRWSPKVRGKTTSTLTLPLTETAGTAFSSALETGPYSPAGLVGTVSESYTGGSLCGVPHGSYKHQVITAVRKGTFTGSAVTFHE